MINDEFDIFILNQFEKQVKQYNYFEIIQSKQKFLRNGLDQVFLTFKH
ncbi:hypothetical protein pb186bvf_000100 [Paramecium bursaria]